MSAAITSQQRIVFSKRLPKPRSSVWWGPLWRGLFVDPAGKHYRAMGPALWLFSYLVIHADRRTGKLFRVSATIAKDMGLSKRTIQAWLSVLRKRGYITTKRTGRALEIIIERWRPIVKTSKNEL